MKLYNISSHYSIQAFSGNYILVDVHGAGAQRSDAKSGDPGNYPHGFGPRDDVIRIDNYVRLVRDSGTAGTDDRHSDASSIPGDFRLNQNYPIPFNLRTIISFSTPVKGSVSLYNGSTAYTAARKLI